MKKELYYRKSDAMKAAQSFLDSWGGWVRDSRADDKTKFDYEDNRMQNMCWSGELAAVEVIGCRQGMSGLFAWWEEL